MLNTKQQEFVDYAVKKFGTNELSVSQLKDANKHFGCKYAPQWLIKNDLNNLTFFGQDWGGLIGLRMIAQEPERFNKVAMGNTGLPYNPDTPFDIVDQVKAFRESDLKLTPIMMFKQVSEMDKGKSHPALKFMYWQKFCWDTVDLPIGFLMEQMMGKSSKLKRILYLIFVSLGISNYFPFKSKIAKAFEMNVLYHSVRKNNHNKLSGFLKKLDILSIHCPLTASTNNLIKSKELNLLKKTTIIINTARGGIVNEDDLVKAIKNGTICGAGIDVTTKEPPNKNHPYYSILNYPNFIWTPHTAWASNETLQEAINQLIDNVNSFYNSKLKNIVK